MDANNKKKLQKCPNCGHTPLQSQTVNDRFEYTVDDETSLTIDVPDVPVEVCPNCGETYFGPTAAKLQHAAVCKAVGLLTPSEIQIIRERFGPTQAEFARLTGIGEATISRWERGRILPNRAMDRFLRLLDYHPSNSHFLKEIVEKAEKKEEKVEQANLPAVVHLEASTQNGWFPVRIPPFTLDIHYKNEKLGVTISGIPEKLRGKTCQLLLLSRNEDVKHRLPAKKINFKKKTGWDLVFSFPYKVESGDKMKISFDNNDEIIPQMVFP